MTRCAITCSEYGCDNKIFYEDTDATVRLYCSTHRTGEGRHSAVRELVKPKILNTSEPEKIVEYVCANKKCNNRKQITFSEHMKGLAGNKQVCEKCGRWIIYRKDL